MLALDAGYINFVNHSKVNRGRNHNVILVDGEGPPLTIIGGESVDGGNDAFIEQYFTSTFMDYAEVRAGYEGVGVRRRVMFPGRKYFVVADELRDDQTHRYEFRLHGHGGGSSGGSYAREGSLARWTRTGAELLAYMPPRESLEFSERDTLHSFDYLEEPTHTVFRAEQSSDNAEFLTVLYPRPLDQAEPVFSGVEAQGGQVAQVVLGEVEDLAWLQEMAASTIAFEGPVGSLSSDGRFGFVRFEGQKLTGFNVQDGSYLNAGEGSAFTATEAVDFSLEVGDTWLEGFVRGPDTGYQLTIPLVGSVESLTFGGTLIDMSLADDGMLTMDLAGEGALSLALSTVVLEEAQARPSEFRLLPNYPNPFNARTTIVYQLPQHARAQLTVYNLVGQPVKRLVDGVQPAGAYLVSWDGTDSAGKAVGSGVYLYRLEAGEYRQTRRLLLLK